MKLPSMKIIALILVALVAGIGLGFHQLIKDGPMPEPVVLVYEDLESDEPMFGAGGIRVDATSSGEGTSGTTVTISHTIGTEGNEVLVVSTGGEGAATGVTWNGTAMTKVAFGDRSGNQAAIWFLGTPDTGTHDIVITKPNGSGFSGGGISFFDASSTVGGSNSANGSGTTPTTIVTVSGSIGIAVDAVWSGGPTPTEGSGQTKFYSVVDVGAGTRDAAGSYEAHTGSNVTMSWSMSSDSWAIAALEVVEDISGASFQPSIFFL